MGEYKGRVLQFFELSVKKWEELSCMIDFVEMGI